MHRHDAYDIVVDSNENENIKFIFLYKKNLPSIKVIRPQASCKKTKQNKTKQNTEVLQNQGSFAKLLSQSATDSNDLTQQLTDIFKQFVLNIFSFASLFQTQTIDILIFVHLT